VEMEEGFCFWEGSSKKEPIAFYTLILSPFMEETKKTSESTSESKTENKEEKEESSEEKE